VKAALFHEVGGPDVLRIEDVPEPEPAAGEVKLRVRAVALNHLDLWVRRGLPTETPMPHIGGSDVAGIVTRVGPGVRNIEPGMRVVVDPTISCGHCVHCRRQDEALCRTLRILGEHTQGGLAEYVVVPAENVHIVPDGFPLEAAAAAPLTFATAWRGLISRARLQAGETILVTGASGGVATAAIQIAQRANARIFAVTTTEHIERVRALGAHVVYDRNVVDFSREIWRDTDRQGVDVIFDSVGAATWHNCLRALARAGRLVVYGATSAPSAATDIRFIFWKQLSILGTTMSNRAEFQAVMSMVFNCQLEPVIDVVWPLERIRAAHERLEKGEQFGKIVLLP
jgi:NADPH:quinone reductase-like Zn-dependent oxidoreductase